MAWIAAAGGLLKGIAGGASEKKAKKQDFKNTWRLNEQEGAIGRKNTDFSMALEYYYNQLGRQEKMRGLDEFRKFSTVTEFAPNYQNTTPAPVMPVRPVADQGAYAPNTTVPKY